MSPIGGGTEVYRALTKNPKPTEVAFFLRPDEDSLSIARTEAKARGTLSCKGYAVLTVSGIEAIDGLRVQVKRDALQPDPNNVDPDLLEVMGMPFANDPEERIKDYANALLQAVVRHVSFKKPIRLEPADISH